MFCHWKSGLRIATLNSQVLDRHYLVKPSEVTNSVSIKTSFTKDNDDGSFKNEAPTIRQALHKEVSAGQKCVNKDVFLNLHVMENFNIFDLTSNDIINRHLLSKSIASGSLNFTL